MALTSRTDRLIAIGLLMGKGLQPAVLQTTLYTLSCASEVDFKLVRFLIDSGVPVDNSGEDDTNCVFAAARRKDLKVLRLLCQGRPTIDTLSRAVPMVLGTQRLNDNRLIIDTIRLLCHFGATGEPLNEALLLACQHSASSDTIALLLEHGADPHHGNGVCFTYVLQSFNRRLLIDLLKVRRTPTLSAFDNILGTIVQPKFFQQEHLEHLLSSASCTAAILNASWASAKYRGNPNIATIVPSFLDHGMDVNLHDGALLCFAVEEDHLPLLIKILSSSSPQNTLKSTSFRAAFEATTKVKLRSRRLKFMEVLLQKAAPAEIGQTVHLLSATGAALKGDLSSLNLMLQHNAMVDREHGNSILLAATGGSSEVLKLLLSRKPNANTVREACHATAACSLGQEQKHLLIDALLTMSDCLSTDDYSQLLKDSVARLPDHAQLPKLLLVRHAKVSMATLDFALQAACRDLFTLLFDTVSNVNVLRSAFVRAWQTASTANRRSWICEYFLQRKVIPEATKTEVLGCALVTYCDSDLSSIKLLLDHGAVVNHKMYDPVIASSSIPALRLLSRYIRDHDTPNIVFAAAYRSPSMELAFRLELYRCMLRRRIQRSAISQALREHFRGQQRSPDIVKLLLDHGADPNAESGLCYYLASRVEADQEFKLLCKKGEPSAIANVLMQSHSKSLAVVRSLKICLLEHPQWTVIGDDDILYRAMKKFPAGVSLVDLLLSRGASPGSMTTSSFRVVSGLEACTLLLWALNPYEKHRHIHNDVLLALLNTYTRGTAGK
jgi:hypothetical protein